MQPAPFFYFNSIKVRLKQKFAQFRKQVLDDFNSIKVRLKPAEDFADVLAADRHFNSIKVRLKHAVCGTAMVTASFQFHKGTIKTWLRRTKDNLYGISIP